MKIRLKFQFIIVPFIVIPLLTLGWFAYLQLSRTTQQNLFAQMHTEMTYVHTLLRHAQETTQANLSLLAQHAALREYVQSGLHDAVPSPLLAAFAHFQTAFPNTYEIRVLTTDGEERIRLTNVDMGNSLQNERSNPIFKALVTANGPYSQLARNPDNNEIALFVGQALAARSPGATQARPRGYLIFTVNLATLKSYISTKILSNAGFLFVTDDIGNVFLKPKDIPFFDTLPTDILDFAAPSHAATAPQLSSVNGIEMYLSGIQTANAAIFAALPTAQLRQISYSLGTVVLTVTLITIALTMLSIYLILNSSIIRPLHKLTAATKEIAHGNLNIETNVHSKDELGELATAFSEMTNNLRHSDEQIRFLAYHDGLTGLPNREMFKEYLNHALASAHRHQKLLSLLFIDLDDFKRINDTLGHDAGDMVLQEMAERLASCLREDDFIAREGEEILNDKIARLGGDEFIVMLSTISNNHQPGIIARRVIKTLAEPISLRGQEYYISASIGISIYPTDGSEAEELVKNADVAMYHSKCEGKNGFKYYQDSMNTEALERLGLEAKLRNAIDQQHLAIYFQTQIDPNTEAVVGMEALLRWSDPDQGDISPDVFIPLAEETGLILPLGEWMLIQACRQVQAWQAQGLAVVPVAINISGVQFSKQDLPNLIKSALTVSGMNPNLLVVEITESAIMSQPDRAIKALDAIKAMDVRVSLDDFGTGYSSLSYLRRFPIDTLKIDHSFVENITHVAEDAEIVAAIVAMAHTLKLKVVAEGVENQQQLEILRAQGCDIVQGYLYSHPLPATQVAALLSDTKTEALL